VEKKSARFSRVLIICGLIVLLSCFSAPALRAQSGATFLPLVTGGSGVIQLPPKALDDAYVTEVDTPLTTGAAGGVLANDTNPSGGPLQAVLAGDAAYGDLALRSDGSFTYTPDAGYTGSDSFTYRATDGAAASQPATVTLTIRLTNGAPIAVDDSYLLDEDTVLEVNAAEGVLVNDSDPDADPLRAELATGPAHGGLSLNVDGSFTYTPDAGYIGPDSFTYRATDGAAASQPATVTLTIRLTNGAPIAVDDSYLLDGDTVLEVNAAEGVLVNDSDPDADPLRAELATGPAYGGLSLNVDGSFTYTPDAGYTGPDSFTYTAGDGSLTSLPATVTLEITAARNAPPRIVSGAPGFASRVIGTRVLGTHIALGADLDGDGDMDITATDYDNGRVVWYENENGNYTERVLDGNLEGAYPASIADVDGDGDADVLAAGYLADTFVWYRNDGGGNLVRIDIDTASDGAHSIVGVDMDGDGDTDLVTSSQDAGLIAWYENDGAQNFTRHIVDDDAPDAKRAEVADMDGDGDLDIVTAEYKRDTIAWLENDGAQNFTKHVIYSDADGAYYAYPADLDGDGDMDVVSAGKLDGTFAWHRNDGGGVFTFIPLYTKALGARSAIAVDLDGDGDMDVLSAALNTDTVAWFENDGGGNFTRRPIDTTVRGAYGVFAADMDLDGDLDVLSAGRNSNEVRLHSQHREHRVTVKQGGSLEINAAQLRTDDPDDGPAELTYTLTAAPARGALRLNSVDLIAGDTFTQDDVNNGRVSYIHNGVDRKADAFDITVADGGEDGAPADPGRFSIKIGRSD